jgi:hypothetical protein
MNEHSFIKSIHNSLHPDVYKWKIHDTYTGGVPDAMYAGTHSVLFVEYKYIKTLPKRNSTNLRHSLSQLQLNWLNRVNQAAQTALIIGAENTGIILVSDFSTNISKMKYIEQAMTRKAIAEWIYTKTCRGNNCDRLNADPRFKPT